MPGLVLIVGLGNPGSEYQATRHNVGFEVAEALAERHAIKLSEKKFRARLGRGRIAGSDCLIFEPQTYMNVSGESVGPALGFYKLTTADLIVVHDDLDLDVGRVKLKKGGGHGGHNGLRSLIQHLPDAEFTRVRVGIGRPPPKWDSADYVLSKFHAGERSDVERAIGEATDAVELIVEHGLGRAMTKFNRTEAKAKSPDAEEAPRGKASGKGS